MDYKKAIEILINLQKKDSLSKDEKEAVSSAVGILSWVSLAKNRFKSHKEKEERDSKW
jgi:hypothetical protein